MAPYARKGRNPGPVDEWLDGLGYYRKNIAYDETCLFRSVSEQLYSSQIFHEKIRKECITYARAHHEEFVHFIPSKDDWEVRLNRLEKHMTICGRPEIHMIIRTFNRGMVLFDGINLTIKELTGEEYKKQFFICHMGEDHYDAVYYKSYIQDSGFCQSIVYNILYENVFHIPKVANIVETMLYHKPSLTAGNDKDGKREENNNVKRGEFTFGLRRNIGLESRDESPLDDYEYMLKTNLAPFPFKVAKALDPTMYRNIEYDTWTEMRKEMRLGEWYYGDHNLIEGSGCVLYDDGEENHCYIQEILKNENCAVVFLSKKGEKRRVRLTDLRPETDAKPWPLPYRFSKHLVISSVPKLEMPEKKSLRKRREKKRTISKCSSTSDVPPAVDNRPENVVAALPSPSSSKTINVIQYEGAPLQMQQSQQPSIEPLALGENFACTSQMTLQHGLQLPAQSQPGPANPGNAGNLGTYDSGLGWHHHEAIIWPPTPPIANHQMNQNVFAYNSVMPPNDTVYQHQQQPQEQPQTFYVNEFTPYNIWPNGEYLAPLPPPNQLQSPQGNEIPITPEGFNYFFSDGSTYSPITHPSTPNRGVPATPTSPQIELYPIYQPTIGTPVIMPPPSPVPRVAMYSPALEVPCTYYQHPQSPFMFPPTPTQPTWYPCPAVNSQGFIFPTINVTPTSPAPTQ